MTAWIGSGFDCGCCCPVIDCQISVSTLFYSVIGATSAYIEKRCGYSLEIIELSPVNGTGTMAADPDCVYTLVAENRGCEKRKSCHSGCICSGREGYVIVDLAHSPGTLFTINTSGTYYSPIGDAFGDFATCVWEITRSTEDECSQWRLERKVVPFVGIRLVFVLLITCQSSQIVKVFNADYCVNDDTYTFGPYSDGSVFTFTIRG